MRDRIARALNLVMEGLVAALAVGSVWPFGSVLPFFQWLLFGAVALLLILWAARTLVEGRLLWKPCPVVICLAALCLMTMLQIVPLPRQWVTTLSPHTTSLRAMLLPSPEETGVEQVAETTATLSLAPGATRLELMRLMAVLALFAAVRNNVVDPGSFYRLAWLMSVNGVILALVGMGQLTSSPRNVVFWSVTTPGQVFGPFVCRNHAAYYLNLCLGLTSGLLLGTRYFLTPGHSSWRGLFRDVRVLWLVCFIGIMLAGLVATLSRGGLIGLALGVAICFGLLVIRFGKHTPWIAGGLIFGLSAALVFWQGSDRVSQRWDNISGANSAPEARIAVWSRSLPLVQQFPLFGAGLGTFGFVEQTCRHPGDFAYVFNDRAHNDFLELWIEGGTIQLFLALAMVLLVLRKGYEAFSQQGNTGLGRLALGGLVGFIAIVFHSFVDFGLHIPAVTVLAAIVSAMLMNLADLPPPGRARPPEQPAPNASMGLAGLQAASLFVVALYLVRAGWNDQQSVRYLGASTYDIPVAKKIEYLQEAVRLAPDRAELYVALADSFVDTYLEKKQVRDWANAASLVAGAGGARYPALLAFCDRSAVRVPERELETANAFLAQACQKNPLLYAAQERLERISTIGTLRAFKGRRLERLVFLSPSDPGPWYWAGKEALREKDKAKALVSFRNSLTAEKKYLDDIVKEIPEHISSSDLLHGGLPASPALIIDAAKAVAKHTGNADEQAAYYKEALRLLETKGRELTDDEWMDKARASLALDDLEAARKSFESALLRNPLNPHWRYEYCELLVRAGDFAKARGQLAVVLHQVPYHPDALRMNERLKAERD